jgi:hypothetical protein
MRINNPLLHPPIPQSKEIPKLGTLDGCPSTDLRGYVRPVDGNADGLAECDMGATYMIPAPRSGADKSSAYRI